MIHLSLKKLILSCICICVIVSTLHARNAKTIRVGVFDYYPTIYKNEKGEIAGFYPEAFKEIETREGIRISYVYGTLQQNIERLKNGEIDILPNIAFDKNLSKSVNYSKQSLTTVWGELYVLSKSNINSINDINEKKIACVLHDNNLKYFIKLLQKFGISCELEYYNSYDDIFQAIRLGKADAGIVNNIYGAIKKHDYNVRPTDIVFNPYEVYFIVQKNINTETLELFDDYIKKWKYNEESVYYTARQKWLYSNLTKEDNFPQWIIWGFIIVSGIAVILFFIIFIFRQKVKTTAFEIIEKQHLIQKTEEQFKTYLEHSPIGVFVLNDAGNYIAVNEAACRITGYSREELLQKNMVELQPPETLEEDIKAFQTMVDTGTVRRDFQILRKDGSKMWSEVNAVKISDKEFLCFGSDIEERKQSEFQILHQTEAIKKQNNELKIAKAKAEESDRLKTAFLQNMSHEIRTPLNAIMGFSQILPDYFNDKESLEKFCTIIQDRGEDLLSMINDILHIAKIESGQLTINETNSSIATIQNDLIGYFKDIQHRLKKDHISLIFNCNQNLFSKQLFLDWGKLKQILINLIHNAFKFTNKGSITVTFSEQNNVLHISVADTGIGISEENKEEIFNRFIQVHNTGKAHIGTGLGLSIVKGLLRHIHGDISITSEIDKGTTFFFTLPFQVTLENNDKKTKGTQINFHKIDLQVLIVEDEQTNADYLKLILSPYITNLYFAKTGAEALSCISHLKLDVLLLDIRLPDMSGHEIAEIVSQTYPKIHIIAQTAFASDEDKQSALNAGCHDFIAKPILKEELLRKLYKITN